ncbi:MAG: hypothetical protein ACLKAK_01130 [Alkaliphilus sp.]
MLENRDLDASDIENEINGEMDEKIGMRKKVVFSCDEMDYSPS